MPRRERVGRGAASAAEAYGAAWFPSARLPAKRRSAHRWQPERAPAQREGDRRWPDGRSPAASMKGGRRTLASGRTIPSIGRIDRACLQVAPVSTRAWRLCPRTLFPRAVVARAVFLGLHALGVSVGRGGRDLAVAPGDGGPAASGSGWRSSSGSGSSGFSARRMRSGRRAIRAYVEDVRAVAPPVPQVELDAWAEVADRIDPVVTGALLMNRSDA
jgi:hypothetical protein